MKKQILIIGGGFAGLAAGVDLSAKGHEVTVIERRGHLGGRAYSFRDPVVGATLDNGQHILMGCYRDTIRFLETIGTLDKVNFQKNLGVDFAHAAEGGGKFYRFQSLPLPNPLHLLSGFFLFRGFSWKDKKSTLGLKSFLKRKDDAHEYKRLDQLTVPQWLGELGQSKRVQERFWDPLTFAALNDRPELCSSALLATVLREALLAGKKGASIGVPKVGLSELYADPARDFIERKGGSFVMKAPVVKLHFKGHEFQEVELEGGRRISADYVLVTTPYTILKKILPESILYESAFFSPLSQLSSAPIVGINLWYDREITDKPFIGLWGTRVHWIFNKKTHLSLVISGAREELKMSSSQIVDIAKAEIESIFPKARGAKLMRSVVTKEPEATMAPAVGSNRWRLPQRTPYQNFFLAGDWTDTGLPATIESAVRSGYRAAELIHAQNSSV